jgi:hypothetical protein
LQKQNKSDLILKTLLILIAILPLVYFNQIKNVPVKAFLLGTGSWGFGLIFKMIFHQIILVKMQRKNAAPLLTSVTNGFLSGLFELGAAAGVILLMEHKFDFDYNAIISFGLAIGLFESLILAFTKGEELLKGTALESTTAQLNEFVSSLAGTQYYIIEVALPVFERILSTFIHISTRGLVFITLITSHVVPFVLAMLAFIIADGILGYYFNITGRLASIKGIVQVYIYLSLLTIIITLIFFFRVAPYESYIL